MYAELEYDSLAIVGIRLICLVFDLFKSFIQGLVAIFLHEYKPSGPLISLVVFFLKWSLFGSLIGPLVISWFKKVTMGVSGILLEETIPLLLSASCCHCLAYWSWLEYSMESTTVFIGTSARGLPCSDDF